MERAAFRNNYYITKGSHAYTGQVPSRTAAKTFVSSVQD